MFEEVKVEEIKALIKDIIHIVEEVPEPYKQMSFQVLLSTFLQKKFVPITSEVKPQ